MIADLTGALATVSAPARRKRRQRSSGRAFEVDVGFRREPAASERVADLVEHAGRIRRVEKYDVEPLRLAAEKGERVVSNDLCVARTSQPFERLCNVPCDLRLAIDEGYV